MTRGGSRKGAGRKALAESQKRKQLSCRVKDETFQWLSVEKDKSNRSIGEIVDLAVEILQKHPEELPPDLEGDEEETND